ncbi:uncharacterized protein LOC115633888 [Scaptodrosophila lebanonensis]|uniref:XK-related protein n=1 Tax=Drosophila lebanonensis TaxID=7225 RepID=A0A6J2UJ62_DROLE|nr:uncharacterized protein LOC115633888 [Scaptodrosophila lebanonensis]
MEVNNAAIPPPHILGYTIRSRTRIYVSYIVPTSLALLVYIVQTSADLALSYQHFRTKEPGFGAGTLIVVLLPAILTFILVLSSKEQRTNVAGSRSTFWGLHVLQLLLFPFFVVYRFTLRLFWAIDALFHDDDDTERMKSLAKATKTSSIELYLLIQAYAQAAPQIILQLYNMLAQDMFRNYETSAVQALSLIFSAINLAAITTSYHRIESQRRVGRHYPWATKRQVDAHQSMLEQNERICKEAAERKKRDSERTITSFPESEKIMANFHARHEATAEGEKRHELHIQGMDEVDNDAAEQQETKVLLHTPSSQSHGNITDDDKIENTRPKLRLHREELGNLDSIEILDTVPETPPPRPPPATAPPTLPVLRSADIGAADLRRTMSDNDSRRSRRMNRPLSQLETFKDMLLVNAQLYIKENVPRPPKMLTTRVDKEPTDEHTPLVQQSPAPQTPNSQKASPLTPKDVVDFYFPRPTKIVNGIQQDDFAGRSVAFFGWMAFIIMRMLSLATFCIFYPKAFFIIVGVHYALMIGALGFESRFRGTWNRTLFYLLLAYIYIFVLLEFRVCFKRIRLWYTSYLILTLAENISMTAIWYNNADFESWWFGFIWEWIIYSGVLFLATIIVYYFILRPKEVALIVEDEAQAQSQTDTPSIA